MTALIWTKCAAGGAADAVLQLGCAVLHEFAPGSIEGHCYDDVGMPVADMI